MIAESLVSIVAFIHLIVAPFTKVEESFNIQACHDILYYGTNLNKYDHHDFPGVVPRSFIGPALLSGLSVPFVTVIKYLGVGKIYSQYVVRLSLAALVIFAWRRYYRQVKQSFGLSVAIWFTLITITQFHFIYYLSRTLPNIFAMIFALLAFSYWLEQDLWKFVLSSGFGIVVFRIELVIILGPMLLYSLFTKRVGFFRLLWWIISIGLAELSLTVAFDSYFWGRLLWPEGEVFHFNVLLNQSHLWGTLPVFWYWYSALPRALGASYLLVPFGLYADSRMRLLVTPAVLFIAVFSLVPHKELRFIIYTFPLLNVVAASGCHYLWRNRTKSILWMILSCGAAGHLIGNVVLTSLLLTVSSVNYPGGAALIRLHQTVPADFRLSVHMDNLAAQSGVSRFTQSNDNWLYNKTENLKAGGSELRRFSHLLIEAKTKYAYNLKHYADSHNILEAIESFSHISFNYQHFPPLKIRTKPTLFILENLMDEDIEWNISEDDPEWIKAVEEMGAGVEEKKEVEDNKKVPQMEQDKKVTQVEDKKREERANSDAKKKKDDKNISKNKNNVKQNINQEKVVDKLDPDEHKDKEVKDNKLNESQLNEKNTKEKPKNESHKKKSKKKENDHKNSRVKPKTKSDDDNVNLNRNDGDGRTNNKDDKNSVSGD